MQFKQIFCEPMGVWLFPTPAVILTLLPPQPVDLRFSGQPRVFQYMGELSALFPFGDRKFFPCTQLPVELESIREQFLVVQYAWAVLSKKGCEPEVVKGLVQIIAHGHACQVEKISQQTGPAASQSTDGDDSCCAHFGVKKEGNVAGSTNGPTVGDLSLKKIERISLRHEKKRVSAVIRSLFLLVMFLGISGYAQQRPLFGLDGGLSVAFQEWESSSDLRTNVRGPRIGLLIAANMEFYHEEQLSLITELAYVQKGSNLDMQVLDPNQPGFSKGVVPILYSVDYVHWWAAAKIKANWERLQPYVFIGPRLDIQVSPPVELPVAAPIRTKLLFGSTFGGGLQYLPKSRNYVFFVQGNLLYDFREMHSAGNGNQPVSVRVRNVAVGLTAGVKTRIIFER
jgi:hypothetical protein